MAVKIYTKYKYLAEREKRKRLGSSTEPTSEKDKMKAETLKGATGCEECWSVENRRASKARVRRKRTALG